MRDDEKMFRLGIGLFLVVAAMIVFLQVGYRVQDKNIKYVRDSINDARYEFATLEAKFSNLSSGNSLRDSLTRIYPKATTVSYSKTIHIDDIPMVTE